MKKEILTKDKIKVQILESAFDEIRKTIGSLPAESGGLPFGKEDDMIIRAFVFDKKARTTRSTYSFDTDYLNPEIKRMWNENGLSCLGFIHSHPYGNGRPSLPDIAYFSSMFESMPRPYYIVPIIFTEPDGGFQFIPYIIYNGAKEAVRAELEIILDDKQQNNTDKNACLNDTEQLSEGIKKSVEAKKITNFSRIEGAIDVKMFQQTNIIGVGAGGAYCLYESLARSGLGNLTVLDFDTVDDVNIVRQGYELKQTGRTKVDALGEHLKNINGGMNYTGITKNFLDMNQEELDRIFGKGDLFLFLTDSFAAQAFGNKLALYYGKPAIWAGFYEKSQAAEIVFTIPGVTPACFRCAVSPRYEAQAKSTAGEIRISSNCNTIFHSQLLDALVGMLTMAILHNNTSNFEFSGWFGEKWDRNLLQIKVHPSYGSDPKSLFFRTFANLEGKAFTFNTIFQKITPECPPEYTACPDCGGSGDLTTSYHI